MLKFIYPLFILSMPFLPGMFSASESFILCAPTIQKRKRKKNKAYSVHSLELVIQIADAIIASQRVICWLFLYYLQVRASVFVHLCLLFCSPFFFFLRTS